MAKNNWDKELNNIGKQMDQIQKEEVNRKDLYWAFGLLAVALAFLLRILEESILLSPAIAGVLTGAALIKLKRARPQLMPIAVVVGAVFTAVMLASLEIPMGIDMPDMMFEMIFEQLFWAAPAFVTYAMFSKK